MYFIKAAGCPLINDYPLFFLRQLRMKADAIAVNLLTSIICNYVHHPVRSRASVDPRSLFIPAESRSRNLPAAPIRSLASLSFICPFVGRVHQSDSCTWAAT